jgi:hypothetical protein
MPAGNTPGGPGRASTAAALAAALALAAAVHGAGPPQLEPRIDEAIATDYDGGSPFFPTGHVVWVTHPQGWGFPADVHLIHHEGGEAMRVRVRWNGREVEPAAGRVLASRGEMSATAPGLAVHEAKLLTPDDVLVSVLEFKATAAGVLEVEAASPWAKRGATPGALTGAETFHGVRLAAALSGPPGAGGKPSIRRDLVPGETLKAVFALALAGSASVALDRARATAADADPVATQAAATERWFRDRAPGFDCPDPGFNRAFLYRLLVIKKSIVDPGAGFLKRPAAVEGRWATKWYPSVITFGAGHQLAEMRWLKPPLAWDHLEVFLANQRGDGAFLGARVDALLGEYTDFIALGAADLYHASGDRARFAAAALGLARNADYILGRDCDGDFLPETASHWESGMEWQPSFFTFSGYDTSRETKLERVEYACYLHAAARAAAEALRLAGRDASRYDQIARRVGAAIEGQLWDASARHYLSQRASDDQPALDREVVGFYPAAVGITAPERLGFLAGLADPERWRAPFPVPSVEMASPAFDSYQHWPVGPGGSASMWNGPTWPHAQSFVVRALAAAERAGRVARGATFALLESYTQAHFFGLGPSRRLDRPVVGEMYNPFNGMWLTNERDYFHSTYVDLVVTAIAGLRPAAGETLEIDPLLPPATWDRFALVRLPYHGHELAVVWDAPGGEDAYGDGEAGLVVWVDGKVAARREDLGPLRVTLD